MEVYLSLDLNQTISRSESATGWRVINAVVALEIHYYIIYSRSLYGKTQRFMLKPLTFVLDYHKLVFRKVLNI